MSEVNSLFLAFMSPLGYLFARNAAQLKEDGVLYIAHKSSDGRVQPLKAHLMGVGSLAGTYAEAFDAKEHTERTGQLHDIGKYAAAGQHRMLDPENTPKVDHSSAGAIVAKQLNDLPAAFAVAGHHGGLMDHAP